MGALFIKIGMIVLFFGVMTGVGFFCRRHAENVDSFILGGRSVGAWFTAFAYGTSYFSAVIMVGYSGQFGWRYGIASTWIGLGNALIGSYMAWTLLGRRTRVMTQHLQSKTMPDFFLKRYGSRGLKLGAAAIIFVFLIPYAASLYNGLSRLFAMAFSVDYTVCIVIMALLTAVYVMAGGYMATVINDFIQGVTSFFGPDLFNLVCVVILTSLGTWSLPQMTQKFYAIKDEQAIVKGTVISTLFAVVVAGGCYFMGGFGRLLSDRVDIAANGYDSIIPTMFESFPPVLLSLVIVLVLAASMSTLSSIVLTSSTTLTLDLIEELRGGKTDEKTQIGMIRGLILIFILLSAVIAILQYKLNIAFIAQLMGLSWGAMAGAFLGPYLYGLYSRRVTVPAVWTSFVFGVGLMLLNMFFKGAFPAWLQSPINCGAFVMLASLVLVPLVSAVTVVKDPAKVEDIFACYEKTVTVPASASIGYSRSAPAKKKKK